MIVNPIYHFNKRKPRQTSVGSFAVAQARAIKDTAAYGEPFDAVKDRDGKWTSKRRRRD